ncbi:DUF3306 domain-containing protein [Vibrio brasiliensis]|uniref:DUF3306 domain-containing protein n=1 Tax=Vibrio brasiliensis TaxID=170652 RepID=UPI001EFEAADC|nr:DUF3306 domain-containing protein [Vibrio brasiliensis]
MATNFLSRWSKRKLEGDEPEIEATTSDEIEAEQQQTSDQAGSDVIEAEATQQQSESEPSVASLLASEAESSVKKAALRKLFLSGQFSEIDGLNDYDHDYKAVKSLSSEVASKLRDWMNSTEEEQQPDQEQQDQLETVVGEDCEPEFSEQVIATDENDLPVDEKQLGQNIPHKQ